MAEYKLSYTASDIDRRLGKVDRLVSSVNGVSPDSSGNVTIEVSGGSNITVDTSLSSTSTNPVQNKVIYDAFKNFNDELVAEFKEVRDEIDNLSASGGNTGGSGSVVTGKTLVGEFTLNNTNFTAETNDRYRLGTDLQATMSNIISKLNSGFDVLTAEINVDGGVMGAMCTYIKDENSSVDTIYLAARPDSTTGEFLVFEFDSVYSYTNYTELYEAILSGNVTMDVKFYTVSSGSGSGGGDAIIDVGELPSEYINEQSLYRLVTGTFIYNRYYYPEYPCYCVDALPSVGNPVTDLQISFVCGYYNMTDGEAYGYVNSTLSAAFGVPVGWYTLATLLQVGGMTFSGVITDIMEDPQDSTFRIILTYEMYSYKGKWTAVGSGAMPKVSSDDNGKILMVVDGQWAATTIENGDEVAY